MVVYGSYAGDIEISMMEFFQHFVVQLITMKGFFVTDHILFLEFITTTSL